MKNICERLLLFTSNPSLSFSSVIHFFINVKLKLIDYNRVYTITNANNQFILITHTIKSNPTIMSSHRRCSTKKLFLKINANYHNTCTKVSYSLRYGTLFKKGTLEQVFSCELCKFFWNIFFNRAPPLAASEQTWAVVVGKSGWYMSELKLWRNSTYSAKN